MNAIERRAERDRLRAAIRRCPCVSLCADCEARRDELVRLLDAEPVTTEREED